MRKYFHLFRYPNLLIIAFTQLIVEYFIILPSLNQVNQPPLLNEFLFFLLVISTIIITAIGYVQNDIEDLEMDRINKPDKMVVGRLISIREAKMIVLLLTLIGTIISLYVAVKIEQIYLALIFPIAVGVLILYAKKLKKGFLLGNAVVSLFVAGVAGIVWFAERAGLSLFLNNYAEEGKIIWIIFLAYLTLAFLANLYREIVKDMQDVEGDKAQDSKTLPIKYGQSTAKWIAFSVATLLLISIILLTIFLYQYNLLLGMSWVIVFIILPLLFSIISLLTKPLIKSTFKQISLSIKLIMLAGLLLLIIVFN